MDPSGYCHRKPSGAWIRLLPRSFARRSAFASRLGLASVSGLSFRSLPFPSARLAPRASQSGRSRVLIRTLKTAQVPRPDLDRGRNFQVSFLVPFVCSVSFVRSSAPQVPLPIPPSALSLPDSHFASLTSHFPQRFPRSSPRPISIIKLHTLPHFHR